MSAGEPPPRAAFSAALATLIFVLVVPVPVALLAPRALSGWRLPPAPGPTWALRAGGAVLFLAGVPVLAHAMSRFVREGRGRQALVFGSGAVLRYGIAVAAGFALFVRLYEEPTLRRRYAGEYEAYCRGVRRWWPRLQPWSGS